MFLKWPALYRTPYIATGNLKRQKNKKKNEPTFFVFKRQRLFMNITFKKNLFQAHLLDYISRRINIERKKRMNMIVRYFVLTNLDNIRTSYEEIRGVLSATTTTTTSNKENKTKMRSLLIPRHTYVHRVPHSTDTTFSFRYGIKDLTNFYICLSWTYFSPFSVTFKITTSIYIYSYQGTKKLYIYN